MDSVTTTTYAFEQSMRILDLAFDYLSINPSEKEKIVRVLEKKFQERSGINLTDIFRQENLISDDEAEYLRIFDVHLQTLHLDQQFGRIAIANGLATEEDIAKALKDQQADFKKYRINVEIGDVLVENKTITPSDRVSILLTQNRIKDENLFEALNDIGATLMEKDAVNKRFGVLAIKKGLVTIEQVNAALEAQKNERNTKGKSQFIGQILQETAGLSEADVQQVLLEQKQFEKRRLGLENALHTVKSEIKISKKLNQLFEYTISKDGVEAFAKKIKKTDEIIPAYEFLIWLRRTGIKFGVVTDSVLEEFIQKAEKNTQIVVAKGYPAEQSTNDSIEFYFEKEAISPLQTPSDTDYSKSDETEVLPCKRDNEEEVDGENENDTPVFIKKGSLLARVIPGKQGKPGKDVLGFTIQPDKPSICILNAGNGVIKKGLTFFSQIDGCPVLKKNTIQMVKPVVKKTEIQTIRGNISDDTKETYESASVELFGTITPEAILRCRSLLLHGNLMGCVICTGNIDVKGDIGSDGKMGGQSPVKASQPLINTIIQTAGKLLALNSRVIGSEIIACKGMMIRDVNAPSILRFGLKPEDKILAADHMIDTKNDELSILKKEVEIAELTEEYKKDLEKEENHQIEQAVLKNLVEIIEAPELYHQEGLENKIKHLYRLPDFSSIKSYYLKLPETETDLAVRNQIMASMGDMSLENFLSHLQKKIDPKPEDETEVSNIYRIESQFKGRLAAIKQEIADKSEEIEKIENEIKGLQTLRARLQSTHVGSLSRSTSEIKIKNMCEKGTIIKGRIARLVVEKTLYNVNFKEVLDPKTKTVSIIIGTY